MGRAPCCDKANVKKGPWSPEEDSKLKEYIEKHGTGGNWIALPQKAGLRRCGKSCRLRWLNYLRPNIKHGEFSDEEDRIICTLYANIGSRWSIIAAQLPGRTDNDIKNYWNTKLKKKLMGLLPEAAASHNQKKLPYQYSSPQNPPFPSHYNSTTTTTTTTTSSSSYYNHHPNTSFTTNLEQISVPTSSTTCYTSSISHQLPFYQNQESTSSSSLVVSPMQYYNNMFGSEGSCSTSSDGSCSFVKQEELMMGFQNFMCNNTNKLMPSQSEYMSVNVNNQWEVLEKTSNGCFSPLDCDIELIKQLISSSNNGNNNDYDGYLNFSVDENKTKEEKKSMHYYYYY